MPKFNLRNLNIGVVGLGYVGLPLAVEFGKRFDTVGFDIKTARVDELRSGHDSTLETTGEELAEATRLRYTTRLEDLKPCRVFIVTVPTPIDEYKRPDLTPLVKSSEAVGQVLKKGDVVVYESTVYPGCTLCEHCPTSGACHIGDNGRERLVEAHNPLGAAVGDRVRVAVSTRSFLPSSFLLYIVPLIALVVGAIIGRLIGARLQAGPDPELLSAIFGVFFLIGSFPVTRVGSRALSPEAFRPQIVPILDDDEA